MQGCNGHQRTQLLNLIPNRTVFTTCFSQNSRNIISVEIQESRIPSRRAIGNIILPDEWTKFGKEILLSGPWNGFTNITENIKTK